MSVDVRGEGTVPGPEAQGLPAGLCLRLTRSPGPVAPWVRINSACM